MSVVINATNIVIAIIIIIFDICICFIVAEAEDEASSGWGDLNERWQALRGSPPPQQRRLASPPPSSPGNLAAPMVVDEEGDPIIPVIGQPGYRWREEEKQAVLDVIRASLDNASLGMVRYKHSCTIVVTSKDR